MSQRFQAHEMPTFRRMSTHARAAMNKSARHFGLVCAVLACLSSLHRARAQAAPTRADFGANKQVLRDNGVRLEGNAFINRPELQVKADVIALDYDNKEKKIQQVRAVGRVRFKMDLPPRDGGAPAHVEATCNNATLDPATRTLVLTGQVDGFYQIRGGGQNSLKGDRATLIFPQSKQLSVDLEGGKSGVRVVVPAETLNSSTSVGTVVITAQSARIRGAQSTATFTGNAHAVSNDGPSKFDITAPEFIISRGAGDTIDTLKTAGRTLLKIDLPPDATPNKAATPDTTANTNSGASANNISRPTYMEVSSDALTMNRSDNTMVFDGRVTGFYRLRPVGAPASDYNFNGDRAVVRYAQPADSTVAATSTPPVATSKLAGLQVEVTGKPSTIQVPEFNLGF